MNQPTPTKTPVSVTFSHLAPGGSGQGRSSRSSVHGNEEKLSVLFEVVSDFFVSTPQGKWPWPHCKAGSIFLAGDSGTCVIFWVAKVLEEHVGNICASTG